MFASSWFPDASLLTHMIVKSARDDDKSIFRSASKFVLPLKFKN